MPIWSMLVALLLFLVVVLLACEYFGVDSYGAAAFAVFANLGPAIVLIYRLLAEWTALPSVHLAAQAE